MYRAPRSSRIGQFCTEGTRSLEGEPRPSSRRTHPPPRGASLRPGTRSLEGETRPSSRRTHPSRRRTTPAPSVRLSARVRVPSRENRVPRADGRTPRPEARVSPARERVPSRENRVPRADGRPGPCTDAPVARRDAPLAPTDLSVARRDARCAPTDAPPLRVVLLHPLLVLLAADAERRLGAGLEALDRDLLAALFADRRTSRRRSCASAFSILSRKLFSRPRSRNVNDWRYSLDARSISSGRSSVSSAMSSSSVCFAFLRISSRFSVSSVLNFFRVALFTVALEIYGARAAEGRRLYSPELALNDDRPCGTYLGGVQTLGPCRLLRPDAAPPPGPPAGRRNAGPALADVRYGRARALGPRLRIGIDENGLGPRLGPLIVTAVIARTAGRRARAGREAPARAPCARGSATRRSSSPTATRPSARRGRAPSRARMGLADARGPTRSCARSRSSPRRRSRPCPGTTPAVLGRRGRGSSRADEALVDTVARDLARSGAGRRRPARRVRRHRACGAPERRHRQRAVALSRRPPRDGAPRPRRPRASRRRGRRHLRQGRRLQQLPAGVRAARRAPPRRVEEGAQRSEYPVPGVGRSPSCATPTRRTCSWHGLARGQMGARSADGARRPLPPRGRPDLPDASGYHDPVTTRFIDATRLARGRGRSPTTASPGGRGARCPCRSKEQYVTERAPT